MAGDPGEHPFGVDSVSDLLVSSQAELLGGLKFDPRTYRPPSRLAGEQLQFS